MHLWSEGVLCSVLEAVGDGITLLCFAIVQLPENFSHSSTSKSAYTSFTSKSHIFFFLFLLFIFFVDICPRLTFTSVTDGVVVEAASISACPQQVIGQEDSSQLICAYIFRYICCSYVGPDFLRSAGSSWKGLGACSQPGNASSTCWGWTPAAPCRAQGVSGKGKGFISV